MKNYLPGRDSNALFNYKRRAAHNVQIGNLTMGSSQPIRIQSMANTDTNDTNGSVEQCIRIIKEGGELVRFTAQGVKEAKNLQPIREELTRRGFRQPLVADIHFNPKAADEAALHVEKVRINPGNYVDSVHTQKRFSYTDEEYQQEIAKIRERLVPFLNICKANKTAIRIGVNHGSLSDRILSRYGDTQEGMVESCMEFLRICQSEGFSNVVISIKASNTVIMVETVRLLVATMAEEGMDFPLHIGVTEAGDGEDGRIKSAVGIGALLCDGIGDTIRVSLSEDPEKEIPVAKALADYVSRRCGHKVIDGTDSGKVNPYSYSRRKSTKIGNIGGNNVPIVIANSSEGFLKPDYVFAESLPSHIVLPTIVDYSLWQDYTNLYPLFTSKDYSKIKGCKANIKFVLTNYPAIEETLAAADNKCVFIVESGHINSVGEQRAFVHALLCKGKVNPVVLKQTYNDTEKGTFQIKCGADMGSFFIDGIADGLWLEDANLPTADVTSGAFAILQASRSRMSKTEYISCPSCGRTLYDMQSTIAQIKAKTSHLKNLKIGIMGCIVNGPGEMADADYGYVGSGVGKVNLYKGQECVEKMIPAEEAVEKLIELIKSNGDWHEA